MVGELDGRGAETVGAGGEGSCMGRKGRVGEL